MYSLLYLQQQCRAVFVRVTCCGVAIYPKQLLLLLLSSGWENWYVYPVSMKGGTPLIKAAVSRPTLRNSPLF